jgi:hypothetical protein
LLLIGGILLGFEGQDRQGLPWSVRRKLESALVTAAQLALDELDPRDGIDGHCIIMVLNYSFQLLSDVERDRLNYDRLLPVMVQTTYFSPEGFESAYFLGSVDQDIVQTPSKRFAWPSQSATVQRVTAIASSPLVSALGPLSRLIAHAVENSRDPRLVARSVDRIADFVRTLMVQWRQNKLSEVDKAEEQEFLEAESLRDTIPNLWKLLRNCLYSVVIILRAVLGRIVNDRALASDKSKDFVGIDTVPSTNSVTGAPFISMQTLHILRNLYFISSRVGQNSSSQHTFVTLAAVDILAQYPNLTENFLTSIKPSELGQIPAHPLDRCLDLYFLNTSELFTTVVSPKFSEDVLIQAALPYLPAGGNNHLLEIFEAAHSLVLAVFAIPNNAAVAAKHLPFYIDNLLAVSQSSSFFQEHSLSTCPGIPQQSLRPSIPPRFQDSSPSHRSALPNRKPPAHPPLNSS